MLKVVLLTVMLLLIMGKGRAESSAERYGNFIAQSIEKEAKVQVSLQHQFYDPWPLFYAYTFKGFWLTDARSAPFKDINHHPEIYVRKEYGELGYEHFSNGRDNNPELDGEVNSSRSLQRAYIEPLLVLPQGWRFHPRLSAPVFYRTTSQVHDYIGHVDLMLSKIHRFFQASMAVRRGRLGGRLKVSVSANPMALYSRAEAAKNRTLLYFEGFYGHAESLLEYQQKTSSLRLGLRFMI